MIQGGFGGGGASPNTLTFSEKTITYRLTLRTFRGGPVGILYFFFELVIFRGGPVKKITLYILLYNNPPDPSAPPWFH